MNFGLQMWPGMKVNTGREPLHFRFVPREAESAKSGADGDSFALLDETPGDGFPEGGDAVESGKEMSRRPTTPGVVINICRDLDPCSESFTVQTPLAWWVTGSPPTTLAGLLEASLWIGRTKKFLSRDQLFWSPLSRKKRQGGVQKSSKESSVDG